MTRHLIVALVATILTAVPAVAGTKVADKAKDVADPNCTVSKAAKGAAMKSTVGVGNRCGVGETARDVTGTDGKVKDVKKKVSN